MIEIAMTRAQFAAKAEQLQKEQGIELAGDHGVLEKDGKSASYLYTGKTLQIEVLNQGFLARRIMEMRIKGWLTSPPGPGKVSTSVAALIALTLCCSMTLGLAGCTSQQQKNVKQAAALIGAEIPKAMPLITAATAVASGLMPTESILITGVSATVQAGLATLAALCNTYASNPSDSIWQSILATINQLVTTGASGLLDAAKISNPNSRMLALSALGAIQTALLIIDGFVQTTRTAPQNAAAAQARLIKLEQIAPWLNHQMIEQATGHDFNTVMAYEASLGY